MGCRERAEVFRARREALCIAGERAWLILAAIITVYIVLGVLYESYIHPVTILSTLPSAGVGAILALMLFRMDLSVMALIGIILLIGIVKKNAIMMIDFALEAERQEGKPPLDAIYEACLLRFRPIMMTTMAALFGAVPLALGTGTGSELRRPLGITIVGGLIFSQMLTLYTTPVVYLGFDRLSRRFGRYKITNTIIEEPIGCGAGAMNISAPFIRRPIATSLLTIALLLAGGLAYFRLPVASLPQVDFPVITVGAWIAGRKSGDDGVFGGNAAGAAIRKNRWGKSDDLDEPAGLDGITLQFDLNRDINAAARDVQAAINAAQGQLPANLPSKPTYRKVNPADAPIMILGLTSDVLTLPRCTTCATRSSRRKWRRWRAWGRCWWAEVRSPQCASRRIRWC